ncbi:MAG: alpha/beta hydrolase [Candidatus Thiodiazotropha sp. L084R]
MSKIVIGIHGLSNKPAENILEKWWEEAIREGLSKNQEMDNVSLNFSSVYWADVLYEKPNEQPENHPDAYRPAAKDEIQPYNENWVDSLREKFRDAGGDAMDTLKEWFGIDKTADKVLEKKLPDLSRYYKEEAIRKELRRRLKDEIRKHSGQNILLIAHSMGSIIAYDVLREMGHESPKPVIDHFLTIGSPLGLPHVKMKIEDESAPVRTPTIVKLWSNLADRRDPVAVDLHLGDDFGPNVKGVRVKDDLVLNDWGGINHKSFGYLRTPEFSAILAEFLDA